MEQYIQGQSRDLVDRAYTKFVSAPLKITFLQIIRFNLIVPISAISNMFSSVI